MSSAIRSKAEHNSNDNRIWVWKNHIPMYLTTIVDGDSGIGKSRVIADLLGRVVRGEEFPDGAIPQKLPGGTPRVILINTESDDLEISDTYQAQGWSIEDTDDYLDMFRGVNNDKGVAEPFNIDNPRHLETLKSMVDESKSNIIVLDPLIEFHHRSSISETEIRGLTVRLNSLARLWRVAIIAVVHWNKNEKQSNNNRMSGSHQLAGGVRSRATLYREKGKLFFWQTKNSNGPTFEGPTLSYTIDEPLGKVTWSVVKETIPKTTKSAMAEAWLKDYLANGARPVSECKKASADLFSVSTLERAHRDLEYEMCIHTEFKKEGPYTVAYWGLGIKLHTSAVSSFSI